MRTIFSISIILFLATALSGYSLDLQALAHSNDSCEFYVKLENERQCQVADEPSDYLIAYGLKYCSRYLTQSEHWHGALKEWALNTLVCLKTQLFEHESEAETCSELESLAFDSHPFCYVDNGFCELATKDKITILRHLSCLDLMLKPSRSLVQAIALIENCTADINFASLARSSCSLL